VCVCVCACTLDKVLDVSPDVGQYTWRVRKNRNRLECWIDPAGFDQ